MTHLLVPAALLGACLQGWLSKRPAPLATWDTKPQQTPALLLTRPLLKPECPITTRDFSIPKLLLCRKDVSSQLFLLRFPSPLQQQGCATPLPRCIPPRAPSPRPATCDTHAPRTRPILQSLNIIPSQTSICIAFIVDVPFSVSKRVAERALFNCKRDRRFTTRLSRGSLFTHHHSLNTLPPTQRLVSRR